MALHIGLAHDLHAIDIEVEITRDWFDCLLTPLLARIDESITHVLHSAGLSPDGIDVVLCTGGSSLIGAVQDLLHTRFGDRVEAYDPFAGVARGLAIADYRRSQPGR